VIWETIYHLLEAVAGQGHWGGSNMTGNTGLS